MLLALFIIFSYVLGELLRAKTFPKHEDDYPAFFIHMPIALLSGLTISSTILYFYLWILQVFGQKHGQWYPVSMIIFLVFLLLAILSLYFLSFRKNSSSKLGSKSNLDSNPKNLKLRPRQRKMSAQKPTTKFLFYLILTCCHIAFILWALFLSQKTFFIQDSNIHAGYTVFSDLSPHSALVRSFGIGNNIPAQYPHFSQAGMRYHFFFYFLSGMLNRMGLPLDWAINLPSIIGTYTFLSLLTYASYRLSNKIWAPLLTLVLFAFRSSFSGYTVPLSNLQSGMNLLEVFYELRISTVYDGPLLRDEWGLYNLNVYANQRHLLWGLSIALILFLYFWDRIEEVHEPEDNPESLPTTSFFHKTMWQLDRSVLYLPLLLALPFSYWHGSAAIAALLVLAFWALFCREKLAFLVVGLSTVFGAFVLNKLLSPGSSAISSDSIFHWGYYLPDPSIGEVIKFLVILFGPALLLMLLAPIVSPKKSLRLMAASFFLPSVFALTISLTPDVMVNHKYFMMTQLFLIPFIPYLFSMLFDWARTGHWVYDGKISLTLQSPKNPKLTAMRIALSAVVGILLTSSMLFTGITEYWSYKNQSELQVQVPMQDAFSNWMYQNTSTDTVSLTPTWAMHSYFLSGRQSYYGHSYYASSAGYDTDTRHQKMFDFLAAVDLSEEELRAFPIEENLDYLMVDNSLRISEEFFVNEEYLAELFPEIAYFPEQDELRIYDLRSGARAPAPGTH